MFNTVLYALFPINNGTWTHFHNLLNQSPINDVTVWGCCQLYHNKQCSIDFKLLAQRAGTFQMLKKYCHLKKLHWFSSHQIWECFPTTQLSASMKDSSLVCLHFTAGSFSVLFLDLHHICYFLSTCAASGNKFLMIIYGPKSQLSDGSFHW